MLITYYDDSLHFNSTLNDYGYDGHHEDYEDENVNFSKNYKLQRTIKIILISIVKFFALANNQIIVQNVSNKRTLIFWIAITVLDCIASLATYSALYLLPNWFEYAEWFDQPYFDDRRWRLYIIGFEIIIPLCQIPKLLTAISAVYIVIKGLFVRSNQEQTTIEMDIMDPQLSNNMI